MPVYREKTPKFAMNPKNGFIKEAMQCAYLIESDWDKYDNSGFSTSLRNCTYIKIIEEAIAQKKFQEASNLLWLTESEDRYWLEKKVKQGLGTWQDPISASSELYFSSKFYRRVTIEELCSETIKTYAEKRAYKDLDITDKPSDHNFFQEKMKKWRETKRQEVELLRQKYLKEFYDLSVETQCSLLQKYIEDKECTSGLFTLTGKFSVKSTRTQSLGIGQRAMNRHRLMDLN